MKMLNPKAERRTFECVAVVSPGASVPGIWVAHDLTFDVLAQGENPTQAMDLLAQSVAMIIADDLESGLNPAERRAPQEEWRIYEAALVAAKISLEDAIREPRTADGRVAVLVAMYVLVFEQRVKVAPPVMFGQQASTVTCAQAA